MTTQSLEEINKFLWDDLSEEEVFPSVRPLLAHYTSVEVLEKIVEQNELWFSNPLYMNDWEELQYGMNIGAAAFRNSDTLRQAMHSEVHHEVLLHHFDRLYEQFSREHAIDTYVLCFSRHDPSDFDGRLSMWRGYGAKGSGVAIVFDTAKLSALEDSPLILGSVRYASKEQRIGWVEEKLRGVAALVGSLSQTDSDLYHMAHFWIERLKVFSLFTKHDGFEEEKEWRVVYMSERDRKRSLGEMLDYQITAKGVEPKLKLKLKPVEGVLDETASVETLTNRIILGPSLSSVLSVRSIHKMLSVRGKAELANRVVASSIPFRP